MSQIGWNESNPSDTESAGLGDDRIRSLTTSIRIGMSGEHTWPSSGGDAGVHLLGSARAYVGNQSQVSSSGTDGRLMWTRDQALFFHVGSDGTALIGGQTVISVGHHTDQIPYPQRHQWVEEYGIVGIDGTPSFASTVVTIPNSGYSGIPYVLLSLNNAAGFDRVTNYAVQAITQSSFQILFAGGSGSTYTFAWRSLGTRAL